jgi:hypothetical protein
VTNEKVEQFEKHDEIQIIIEQKGETTPSAPINSMTDRSPARLPAPPGCCCCCRTRNSVSLSKISNGIHQMLIIGKNDEQNITITVLPDKLKSVPCILSVLSTPEQLGHDSPNTGMIPGIFFET